MMIAGLLALALLAGAGAAAHPVGAEGLRVGAVSAQSGTGGATFDPTGGVEDTKKGAKPKPRAHCEVVTDPQIWFGVTGEKPGSDWMGGTVCAKY
jgi:hypothetical protein